ncbi:ferrous iron transport protein A [Thermovibrio guaymasensis]|uniref:Ferrous iron transport protein A n=1 Tax=Thermovibrio guaymasensis TaxID=240167 RepID=A0A420W6P3_9BACT|nr:FeoA family protein [Thermovibrio guaymasensis]RKQ61771.1 ferrous iron transport protein A [Thermovibrio guaymasensis]
MTLSQVKAGEKVRIVNITGGHGLKNRLAAIGIFPGAEVKVVKSPPGPVIVEVAGSRVAIGQGMARKVEVEKV